VPGAGNHRSLREEPRALQGAAADRVLRPDLVHLPDDELIAALREPRDDDDALRVALAGRIVELPGKIAVDLGDWTAWIMLRYGWEPHLRRLIARLVQPGDLAVDAGAHVGAHALALAGLGAQVHAFEPGERSFVLLERNIAANQAAVAAHRVALADRDGDAPVFRYAGGADYPAADTMLLSLVAAPGYVPAGTTPVARLDSFGLAPAFVKVDVEGAELAVLAGARGTLARAASVLLELHAAEAPTAPVLAELRAQGFVVHDIRPAADRLVVEPLEREPATHHVLALRDARRFDVMLV
jgi:FkbM family methyltransferase